MKLTSGAHLAGTGATRDPTVREREKQVRGSYDISRAPADCAPACHAAMACHISKCVKNERAAKQK